MGLLPVDAPLMTCKAVGSDLLWSSAALSHAGGPSWQSPHNGSQGLIKAKVLKEWDLQIRLKKKKPAATSVYQEVEEKSVDREGTWHFV